MTNPPVADLSVPVRRYFRPDGRSEAGSLLIPDASTPERKRRIAEIQGVGIEFTLETFPHMVNLCLDDGTFDYKFEVASPDKVNKTILRLIDEFDLDKYRAAAAAHEDAENATVPWTDEG